MKPAVLMTDPRHFAIKGGANPHTRLPDNTLKTVDIHNAWPQWFAYVDELLAAGVDVYVTDASPEATGMVFAANAGFLPDRLDAQPLSEKPFYVSHFTAKHRVVEQPLFESFMRQFGVPVLDYDAQMRFEGEADAFTIGRGDELRWLFTYGFRSDADVATWLKTHPAIEQASHPVLTLRLNHPAYYHGDCLLCDLGGPLLVWLAGIVEEDAQKLQQALGDRLIELDDEDAAAFVGNSFYVETAKGRFLFSPAEIPDRIQSLIEDQGVNVVPVDISEFFGKGGGGPKCMVFNLGEVSTDDPNLTDEQRAFRKARHVVTLRQNGHFDDVGGWR